MGLPALAARLHPPRMTERPAPPPRPAPPRQGEDRAARLAAALRENLRRRKAQARARNTAAEPSAGPAKVADEKPMG